MIDGKMVNEIHFYLIRNDYIDENEMDNLIALPTELEPISEGIYALTQQVIYEGKVKHIFFIA